MSQPCQKLRGATVGFLRFAEHALAKESSPGRAAFNSYVARPVLSLKSVRQVKRLAGLHVPCLIVVSRRVFTRLNPW